MLEDLYFQGKEIIIKVHAIKQARKRGIAYPDQVYSIIKTGNVERFGKHGIRFVKRSKIGSTICVGQDLGQIIIIKTVERGN